MGFNQKSIPMHFYCSYMINYEWTSLVIFSSCWIMVSPLAQYNFVVLFCVHTVSNYISHPPCVNALLMRSFILYIFITNTSIQYNIPPPTPTHTLWFRKSTLILKNPVLSVLISRSSYLNTGACSFFESYNVTSTQWLYS